MNYSTVPDYKTVQSKSSDPYVISDIPGNFYIGFDIPLTASSFQRSFNRSVLDIRVTTNAAKITGRSKDYPIPGAKPFTLLSYIPCYDPNAKCNNMRNPPVCSCNIGYYRKLTTGVCVFNRLLPPCCFFSWQRKSKI